MTLRIVFFGNSESVFTSRHFAALLEVPADLMAVVDVPPAQRVSTNPLPSGLPNFVDVARLRGVAAFEPERPDAPAFVDDLRAQEPDLLIAAGYGLILKPPTLAVPRLLAANFHASLLPRYRGRHPVFWTLRGGERWAGMTVHAMDAGIDTGDILYQVKVRTRQNDTVATLYARIMDRSVTLIERLVADAERGTIPRQPQDRHQGSYFSFTTEEDFRLDWRWPAEKIRRYVTVTPGKCFVATRLGRIALFDAQVAQCDRTHAPGQIIRIGRTRCVVAAGKEAVSLGRGRLGDEAPLSMAALCRRCGLQEGNLLL